MKIPGIHSRRRLAPVMVAVVVAGCGGGNEPVVVSTEQACTTLAGKTIGGAIVASAAMVAASGVVPTYCKVKALIAPALNFEMRIPQTWNGKLHYGGGGGLNGVIPALYDAPGGGGTDVDNHGINLAALNQGYINISSDSGHAGKIAGAEPADASWIANNPVAERLYAYAALPTVMHSTVELIKTAYGKAPSKSYFEGCSNGGREALIGAQRFPNLFDGVIARAPAYNFVAAIGTFQRNMKATLPNPTLNFTPAKVALLSSAVRAACDADDGVVDGVVSNPAACTFDASTARSTLRCPGGADTADSCLSDAQLSVVDTWTAPALFAGKYAHAGWPLTGNESASGNWDQWLQASAGPGAPVGSAASQFLFAYAGIAGFIQRNPAMQPLAFLDPTASDTLRYDYESNPAALAAFSTEVDASDPDLRPYMNRGGKLLLWHGAADPALSVSNTSAYYRNVVATVGGQTSADSFARYYVAPGVNHCHGGVGADKSDLLAALDAWVVNGRAPSDLSAAKWAADGSADHTRPLCRYPRYPRYVGPVGDALAQRQASNYSCVAP